MDLNQFDIYCVGSFLTLSDLKWNLVVLTDTVFQPRRMNENFTSAVVRGDETETFGFIEKFYFAFLHGIFDKMKKSINCHKGSYNLLAFNFFLKIEKLDLRK